MPSPAKVRPQRADNVIGLPANTSLPQPHPAGKPHHHAHTPVPGYAGTLPRATAGFEFRLSRLPTAPASAPRADPPTRTSAGRVTVPTPTGPRRPAGRSRPGPTAAPAAGIAAPTPCTTTKSRPRLHNRAARQQLPTGSHGVPGGLLRSDSAGGDHHAVGVVGQVGVRLLKGHQAGDVVVHGGPGGAVGPGGDGEGHTVPGL